MANRINPREKVQQKSICFKTRQIMFLNAYPKFNPHIFCQKAIDEQIKYIDKNYLEEKDEKRTD